MGLFDFLSGKSDDDESLDAAPSEPAIVARPAPKSSTAAPTPKPSAAAAPARQTSVEDMPEFGIQKAIELMRDLPQQNVELVVQVVKKTLESMNVDVATIIDDAKTKQTKIQTRIKGLEEEITELKEEIAAREEEIGALKTDFAETRQVRERLELAQKTPVKADVIAPPTGRAPPAAPGSAAAAASGSAFKKPD